MSPAGYRAALLRVAPAMVHHLFDLAVVLFGDLDGRYDRAVTFRESIAANIHLAAQGYIDDVIAVVPGFKPSFQLFESRNLVDAHVVPVICLSNQPARPRLGPNLQPIPSIVAARTINRGQ